MTDGWEYYSAKDLNIKAPCPTRASGPTRTRWTRLTAAARARPSARTTSTATASPRSRSTGPGGVTGSSFDASKAGGLDLQSPLGYSDGTKFSRSSETPSVPAWRGPSTAWRPPGSRSRRPSTCTATVRGATTSATPIATGSRTSSSPSTARVSPGGGRASTRRRTRRRRRGPRRRRAAVRSSVTSTSVRSRHSTWPTPTWTATRCWTVRTIRTTTTCTQHHGAVRGRRLRPRRATATSASTACRHPATNHRAEQGRQRRSTRALPNPGSRTCADCAAVRLEQPAPQTTPLLQHWRPHPR